jgi:hypothetical protein
MQRRRLQRENVRFMRCGKWLKEHSSNNVALTDRHTMVDLPELDVL